LGRQFIGHSDAVWSIQVFQDLLLSCSADDSIKIWNCESGEIKLNYTNQEAGTPSDAKFTKDASKIIVSWRETELLTMVDLETGNNYINRRLYFIT